MFNVGGNLSVQGCDWWKDDFGKEQEEAHGKPGDNIHDIKGQMLVASGLYAKNLHSQPLNMPKNKDMLNTAIPAALVELIDIEKTAFATLSNGSNGVCSIYHTNFRQLNGSPKMNMRDRLEIQALSLQTLCTMCGARQKTNTDLDTITVEYINHFLKFA